MIVTGKGGGGSTPERRQDFDPEAIAAAGRLFVSACRGNRKAFRETFDLLLRAAAVYQLLDPEEIEAVNDFLAGQVEPEELARRIATDSAWPDDPVRALVCLGDLPETFITKPGRGRGKD
jgi:hypothetical protein